MHKDIKKLLKCNGIIRLKDWAQSEGARLEYKIACTLGYKVLDFGEIV